MGSIEVSVGYVYYKTNIWDDNEAFRIAMICLMVIVGLAIIGVIIFVLVRKYRRKPETPKAVNDAEDPSSRYIKRPGIWD